MIHPRSRPKDFPYEIKINLIVFKTAMKHFGFMHPTCRLDKSPVSGANRAENRQFAQGGLKANEGAEPPMIEESTIVNWLDDVRSLFVAVRPAARRTTVGIVREKLAA